MDRLRGMDRDDVERLLVSLNEYEMAVPDELVAYYLMRSGFKTDDVRVQRLIALAAQKLLADVTNDAISHSRLRQQANQSKSTKHGAADTSLLLTSDDLEKALRDYGVTIKKPPYYADHSLAGAQPSTTKKPDSAKGSTGARGQASAEKK